jgi:hypothetical protein
MSEFAEAEPKYVREWLKAAKNVFLSCRIFYTMTSHIMCILFIFRMLKSIPCIFKSDFKSLVFIDLPSSEK